MAAYWFILGPLVVLNLVVWFVLVRMVGRRER